MQMVLNKCLDSYGDILTPKNISALLDIGYVKALNLIKYGGIPHIKIGNTYRISKEIFKEWVNSYESKDLELNN